MGTRLVAAFALVIVVTPVQIITLHVFNIASCVQDNVNDD